ncbi:MAG: hypothetical protein HZA08_07305 [Nitrospirae bacterium]|nr:hypothetical protein [Nitrospirota bacterium]
MNMIKRWIKKFIIRTVVEDIQANGPIRQALSPKDSLACTEKLVTEIIANNFQSNGLLRHVIGSSLPSESQGPQHQP